MPAVGCLSLTAHPATTRGHRPPSPLQLNFTRARVLWPARVRFTAVEGDEDVMNYEDDGQVMTIKEVADFLRVCPSTAYRLVRKEKLLGRKIGGQWRIYKPVLEAYLEQRTLPPTPPEPAALTERPLALSLDG
jgi:excisionase family DNA binding protein